METVVIVILAKDKAHCLPTYLRCIEQQTWPASQSHLYIRTNNNRDDTAELLAEWVEKVKGRYLSVYFDSKDVEEAVEEFSQHEWNSIRFKVLGKIRDASIQYAKDQKAHYFVTDCDNFVTPNTIDEMLKTGLPVVGPMLRRFASMYSNYHNVCDANGYFKSSDEYSTILDKRVRGLIAVDVIHCTYFIRVEVLPHVHYYTGSDKYEYVLFSDSMRNAGIQQYLDNRVYYGMLSMAETLEELEAEPWFKELSKESSIHVDETRRSLED
jgi:hypothetical protein